MLVTTAQARGFASECLNVLITYAFDTWPLTSIFARTENGNTSVERLLLKLGFLQDEEPETTNGVRLECMVVTSRDVAAWNIATLQRRRQGHVRHDRPSARVGQVGASGQPGRFEADSARQRGSRRDRNGGHPLLRHREAQYRPSAAPRRGRPR